MRARRSEKRLTYAAICALIRCGLTAMTGWGVYGRRHLPRRGPVLILCNHQSYLDPLVVGSPLPWECHFMARDTLFQRGGFGRLITYLNAFPVRQEGSDIAAVRETVRRLRAGAVVCIFAEGSRTPDGRIHPLPRGALLIAQRAGVPLLPAVLEGLFEIWPRSSTLPRPGPCWLEYGELIPAEHVRSGDAAQLAGEMTTRLRTMHNRLRQRAGREPYDYTS